MRLIRGIDLVISILDRGRNVMFSIMRQDNQFLVKEEKSENIIFSTSAYDDARKFIRERKHGLGFGEWTPKFFSGGAYGR